MRKIKKFLSLALLLAGLLATKTVLAEGLIPSNCAEGTAKNCNPCDLITLMVNIANLITGLSGALGLLLIIYGGIRWLTAFGKDANIQEGRNAIVAAIVGIAIVLLAWTIISVIIGSLYGSGTMKGLNTGGACYGG